jgi:alpha-beta hydrolase superfamily lysophospholipase
VSARRLARACARVWGASLLALVIADAALPRPAAPARAPRRCPELLETDPWQDRLGAHPLADRGRLLSCAHAATFTAAEVAASPLFRGEAGPATGGYELFVIEYVSEGRPGVARAVTALVYLPSGGAAHVPIVAVDHPFSGIGPTCGPSHVPLATDPLAVPLVGRGYAVLAPDYAGMGVDSGMTSFLVGAAEAAATLDGLRALRELHDPRFDAAQLGADLFLAGHSQGGHAALFTQQLFDPGLGLHLLGSVAIAPAFGRPRDWAALFQDAARPTGAMETIATMLFYGHMLHAGGPAPGTWLSASAQAELPAMLHDQCLPSLIVTVPARFPTLGDLYQKSFLTAAAGCSFEGPCPGFEPWASAFASDRPGSMTSAAPVLVLQGLADAVVSPASVACIVDRMRAGGTPVQACGYAGAGHLGVLEGAVPDLLRWMEARRAGAKPAACRTPLGAACDAPPEAPR